jgi:hypothetical protein
MCPTVGSRPITIPGMTNASPVTVINPVTDTQINKPGQTGNVIVPQKTGDPVIGKSSEEVKKDVNAAFNNTGELARSMDSIQGTAGKEMPGNNQPRIASATRVTVAPKADVMTEARSKAVENAAVTIYNAMAGIGTDENAMIKALTDLPPRDRPKVREKFNELYLDKTGYSFDAWVDSELGQNCDKANLGTIYALVDRSATEMSPLRKKFEADFRFQSVKHSADVNSVTSGWVNNVASVAGYGQGCTGWQEWMDMELSKWEAEGCKVESVHVDSTAGALNHNLARITFPDGTSCILDPWADPSKPFHDEAEYRAERGGKIFEGPFHFADKYAHGRNEIIYAAEQPYYPPH